MGKFEPGHVCYNRPARKNPRVYTERDVGRIVAYCRNDGANDAVLIANIAQAFGRRELICTVFQILDILNTSTFLVALITVLKGAISLAKGLKLFVTGKRSKIVTTFIEVVLPKRFNVQLATFFAYVGAVEIALGGLVVFLTGIANNLSLYLLMQSSCEAELKPLSVDVDTLDLGDVKDVLDATIEELGTLINHALGK